MPWFWYMYPPWLIPYTCLPATQNLQLVSVLKGTMPLNICRVSKKVEQEFWLLMIMTITSSFANNTLLIVDMWNTTTKLYLLPTEYNYKWIPQKSIPFSHSMHPLQLKSSITSTFQLLMLKATWKSSLWHWHLLKVTCFSQITWQFLTIKSRQNTRPRRWTERWHGAIWTSTSRQQFLR